MSITEDLILSELNRARNDNSTLRELLNELVQKVTEMAGGVRVMEEKINNLAHSMERDRTLTAKQIQSLIDDVTKLQTFMVEVQALKQRGWGVVIGMVIVGGAAGAGLKTLAAEFFN